MSVCIRAGSLLDIGAVQPLMTRRVMACVGVQIARGPCFALSAGLGETAFAAGGFCPDDAHRERVCWLFVAPTPPVRALAEGVLTLLGALGPGLPVAAYIDRRTPRDLRFAEWLGFVSSATGGDPNLPAHILRMERA